MLALSLGQAGYCSESDTNDTPADNSPYFQHAVTPYRMRLSLEAGDQAGGPVRYNTRFPTRAGDPNPASYYHAQAYFGLGLEYASNKGALQIGALTRRDIIHRKHADEVYLEDGVTPWRVEFLAFHSEAFSVGWVFGKVYREAPWKASLATVYDQTSLSTKVVREATGEYSAIDLVLRSFALRGRLMMRLLGTDYLDLHAGPDCHIPIYSMSRKLDRQGIEGKVSNDLELKSSAAVGLGAELGVRW